MVYSLFSCIRSVSLHLFCTYFLNLPPPRLFFALHYPSSSFSLSLLSIFPLCLAFLSPFLIIIITFLYIVFAIKYNQRALGAPRNAVNKNLIGVKFIIQESLNNECSIKKTPLFFNLRHCIWASLATLHDEYTTNYKLYS